MVESIDVGPSGDNAVGIVQRSATNESPVTGDWWVSDVVIKAAARCYGKPFKFTVFPLNRYHHHRQRESKGAYGLH